MKIENSVFVAEDFKIKERIPGFILEEIVNYFLENLSMEAVVQVHRDAYGFRVVKPIAQKASKVDIEYTFPASFDGEYICMIHSHNTMRPFFSGIDDADELGVPGLYGVIGSIQEEEDTVSFDSCFRYCFGNGSQKKVELEELFHLS